MGQNRSPSDVRGRGKQPHLRQNSGERYFLGLGHDSEKTGSELKLKTKDGCTIADRGEEFRYWRLGSWVTFSLLPHMRIHTYKHHNNPPQ